MSLSAPAAAPAISVVIATRNRADMLGESLHSVLCQTFGDIEVIIVDDGSEDRTREVVEQLNDPRVRYVHQSHRGISAARNLGTDHARGDWIAVHDDDDVMLPFRLAEQMQQADDDVDFVYGAFINFDDATGELQLHHGRNYGFGPALMSGFAPGHSTWLVRAETMRRFRYDEGIESAVDNNVAFRMLRSGVRFRHSGVVCLLRRVHGGRITDRAGGASQKYVAGLNLAFLSRGVDAGTRDSLVKGARRDWGPVDKTRWQTRYLPYLPDHLVRRSGYLKSQHVSDELVEGRVVPVARLQTVDVSDQDWWGFMSDCSRGSEVDGVRARLREDPSIEELISGVDITDELDAPDARLDALSLLLDVAPNAASGWFAVASGRVRDWQAPQLAAAAARCVIDDGDEEAVMGLIPFRSLQAAEAARRAAFGAFASYRVFSADGGTDVAAELIALT